MTVSEIAFNDMKEELEVMVKNEYEYHNSSELEYETWVALKSYVVNKESTKLNRELNITQYGKRK